MYKSLVALAAILATAPLVADDAQPFKTLDLVNMTRIGGPALSPDGKWVAYELRTTDLQANKGRKDLWLVPVAGGEPRRLTTHEANDSHARWSPDGEGLFFLSSRTGSSQVWRLPVTGGEARQVTDLPLDVGGFAVSPNGRHLAVALEVYPDCSTLDCTSQRFEIQGGDQARLHGRIFVRHWDTWKDGRRSHLYVVPVAGGEPEGVTRGLDADVPAKPFSGFEDITFTPDGQDLIFAARTPETGKPWRTAMHLYRTAADGSEDPSSLTPEHQAWLGHPAFSPDGKTLAYMTMKRPGYESDRIRLVLREWPKGGERVLTEDWDRSVSDYFFSADGKTIYVIAQDTGHKPLFAIDVASGERRQVVSEGTVRWAREAGDRLVFSLDHLRSPVELYTVGRDGGEVTALTSVNGAAMAKIRFGETEQFHFPGWNGERVYGWVVKPADMEEGKKYPVAFLIHGGPQGSFSNNFHYRWNPQSYAGAGYAAVMIDFHGSTGYGQAFTDSIRGDWGGKPLEDLQKGLAHALEAFPFLDGDRVCALGASYGGYMINWIAGQWPERFRCLVNHDGVFDQRSMYYTTEELWFPEWEHGGPYYENVEAYEKHNPARFVDRWKTPMLVIHGALDYRVPLEQGLAAFTALQRRGVPSDFLYFPHENHWVLQPNNSILWHETVLAWLRQWAPPGGESAE